MTTINRKMMDAIVLEVLKENNYKDKNKVQKKTLMTVKMTKNGFKF